MTDANKQIADLKVEVDQLKASLAPTPNDAAAMGRWKDEMRAIADRREAQAYRPSPDEIAAFRAACPDEVIHGIAMRDARAPQGPCSQGPASATVSHVRGPVGGTGWREASPLGPPPGLRYVDAQLDAQDRRDLDERIMQEALAGEPK